jgi:hypothetical protein
MKIITINSGEFKEKMKKNLFYITWVYVINCSKLKYVSKLIIGYNDYNAI